MYNNNREAYREAFYHAWQKHLKNLPVEPLEAQLIAALLDHPEYHAYLEKNNLATEEWEPEENPFIHLSLHLAIREQISTNRPAGIQNVYHALKAKYSHPHEVEHLMMECLAQFIWSAQQTGQMPDEINYLHKLEELVTGK